MYPAAIRGPFGLRELVILEFVSARGVDGVQIIELARNFGVNASRMTELALPLTLGGLIEVGPRPDHYRVTSAGMETATEPPF